jgi:hypothetical protein
MTASNKTVFDDPNYGEKRTSSPSVIAGLDDLAGRFNEYAAALEAAKQALLDEQKRSQDLQSQLDQAVLNPPAEKPLVILVNDSMSMADSKHFHGDTPLRTALQESLKLSQSGTNTAVVLWGQGNLRPVKIENDDDVQYHARRVGLYDKFAAIADYLATRSAEAPNHLVIVSDGDLNAKNNLPKIIAALKANPDTTLDFVILDDRFNTQMAQFARKLERMFPGQVTSTLSACSENAHGVFKKIAAERSAQPQEKPAARSGPYAHARPGQ